MWSGFMMDLPLKYMVKRLFAGQVSHIPSSSRLGHRAKIKFPHTSPQVLTCATPLEPTSTPLSSLFSARWFLSGLCSFFQLGSISRQLWVSCYRASLGNDQEKLTCKSWLSLSKSFLSNQVSFRAAFSCFNAVNLSLTCFTRGLEANIFWPYSTNWSNLSQMEKLNMGYVQVDFNLT